MTDSEKADRHALRNEARARARAWREDLGLTQAQLADRAGIKDEKTINNFESGRTWPTGRNLRAIAGALGRRRDAFELLQQSGHVDDLTLLMPPSEENLADVLIDISGASGGFDRSMRLIAGSSADGSAQYADPIGLDEGFLRSLEWGQMCLRHHGDPEPHAEFVRSALRLYRSVHWESVESGPASDAAVHDITPPTLADESDERDYPREEADLAADSAPPSASSQAAGRRPAPLGESSGSTSPKKKSSGSA